MVGMSRTTSTPGVVTGTTNIDARRRGAASGSVTAMRMRKSATEPFDVNHLCPLITYSSPSRSARVVSRVGSAPAFGSVMENALRRRPSSSGSIHCFFCASFAPSASSSAFPESGALLPNTDGAYTHCPRISCIRPSLTWPNPPPPSSGGRCAAQSPRALTSSCIGAVAARRAGPSRSRVSSGRISSRTNVRIHASCCSNSGSVEKSQAMCRSFRP